MIVNYFEKKLLNFFVKKCVSNLLPNDVENGHRANKIYNF
jgi:hypothetical protein